MKKVSAKYNIFFCIIIVVCILGCGVKGDPVIKKNVSGKSQAVRNLKASVANNTVSFGGDIYTDVSANHYVAVE